MASTDAKPESRRVDFNVMIDTLKFDSSGEKLKKDALRSRWLNQVQWMSNRAKHAQKWYYTLRLTTIIGALIIPALVSFGEAREIRYATVILGLLVAISGAVEEFFRYGERWRHYRQTVEILKSEGWQFFQRIGSYDKEQFASYDAAYDKFAGRVEEIIQNDVGVYVSKIVAETGSSPGNISSAMPAAAKH